MDATIKNRYILSDKRLFLLDYDGTLVEFTDNLNDSIPSNLVLEALKRLANDPANTVVIVSGRDNATLESWLGALPIGFISEHGIAQKDLGGEWVFSDLSKDQAWKPAVSEVMKRYVARSPKSFIEEKTSALVWHYREHDDVLLREINKELALVLSKHDLKVINGHEVIEVLPAVINKGDAVQNLLKKNDWGFILAAGDDTSDEDLFEMMPESAFTIKVRPGRTKAAYQLPDTTAFVQLLLSLTKSD